MRSCLSLHENCGEVTVKGVVMKWADVKQAAQQLPCLEKSETWVLRSGSSRVHGSLHWPSAVLLITPLLCSTRLHSFIVRLEYPSLPSAPETPHYGPHQADHLGAGPTGPILSGGPITNYWVSPNHAFLNPSLVNLFTAVSVSSSVTRWPPPIWCSG